MKNGLYETCMDTIDGNQDNLYRYTFPCTDCNTNPEWVMGAKTLDDIQGIQRKKGINNTIYVDKMIYVDRMIKRGIR